MMIDRLVYSILALFTFLTLDSSAQELWHLSDEFDDASTLTSWLRRYQVEGWDALVPARSADPLEAWYIDENIGEKILIPHTGGYYDDLMGASSFKYITGDFVCTARLRVTGRDGISPVPQSDYSLAGILVREELQAVPALEWTRGQQDFLFLSLGHADGSDPDGERIQQWEIKNTVDGQSHLVITESTTNEAIVQVARIGNRFFLLRHTADDGWVVHGRYDRTEAGPLPETVQVGITAYTNWEKYGDYLYTQHTVGDTPNVDGVWVNNTHQQDDTLDPSLAANALPNNPDIIAHVDYVRFLRPSPATVAQVESIDIDGLPDETVISLFGDAANLPGNPRSKSVWLEGIEAHTQWGNIGRGHVYQLKYRDDLTEGVWMSAQGNIITAAQERIEFTDPGIGTTTQRFYRCSRLL